MGTQMPPIVLSDRDVGRLEQLLDAPERRRDAAAAELSAEIARARVLPASELPADVVSMHSRVVCTDDVAGIERRVTLVYPREADIARGRVSVLSPVGMALLGLRIGQTIEWPTPAGNRLRLTVTECAADGTVS